MLYAWRMPVWRRSKPKSTQGDVLLFSPQGSASRLQPHCCLSLWYNSTSRQSRENFWATWHPMLEVQYEQAIKTLQKEITFSSPPPDSQPWWHDHNQQSTVLFWHLCQFVAGDSVRECPPFWEEVVTCYTHGGEAAQRRKKTPLPAAHQMLCAIHSLSSLCP